MKNPSRRLRPTASKKLENVRGATNSTCTKHLRVNSPIKGTSDQWLTRQHGDAALTKDGLDVTLTLYHDHTSLRMASWASLTLASALGPPIASASDSQ